MSREIKRGKEHPLSILTNEAYRAFSDIGFEIALGPELESEWYNFDVLNMPENHPARDMQDTFWIKGASPNAFAQVLGSPRPRRDHSQKHTGSAPLNSLVLRTHCTSVSARAIEKAGREGRLPCAFISIGKVFRNEATDMTHEMQFYQIDGVVVGEDISLAYLKGVLTHFYKKMLGGNTEIEFRPSFFPFTEPSIEVWAKLRGKWLEMMGSGMFHPNVLSNCGLDPRKVRGFAFGGGLDRIAMIKWDIPDVRLFYQGDLRLNQF